MNSRKSLVRKTPETVGLKIIEFEETTWSSISFLCERAYQYFVWARWEVTQAQLGWVKLSGIRRTTTSRNWVASMACRRGSSRKSSQDSRRWASSKRFKNWWTFFSVTLSISTVESSSCQCSMTLDGEKTTSQKNVLWLFLELGSEKTWYKTCSDKPDRN